MKRVPPPPEAHQCQKHTDLRSSLSPFELLTPSSSPFTLHPSTKPHSPMTATVHKAMFRRPESYLHRLLCKSAARTRASDLRIQSIDAVDGDASDEAEMMRSEPEPAHIRGIRGVDMKMQVDCRLHFWAGFLGISREAIRRGHENDWARLVGRPRTSALNGIKRSRRCEYNEVGQESRRSGTL